MKAIPLVNGGETLVDDEDFARFGHLPWKQNRGGYVSRTWGKKEGGTGETLYLARLIMGAGPGEDVHHVDRNPLNNQRRNLECLTEQEHLRRHPEMVPNLQAAYRRAVQARRQEDSLTVPE